MGKSLPPKAIIGLGKFVWTTLWNLMMSNMAPRSKEGAYVRPDSQFRQSVAGSNSPFPAEDQRYRLYVGLGCPWAHRTLVVRALKGLQNVIDVVVVQPSATEGGWIFESKHQGCNSLGDLYRLTQPDYEGRCTVPVLWDTQTQQIVNNESSEIILVLNTAFNDLAQQPNLDLYPEPLRPKIDQWNEKIYYAVNNGVYRCGFAQTQSAYNEAVNELFQVLDELDQVLANHRYLCGDSLTLADVRLFPTLFRFDVVYYGLFKCNRRRIQDYQHLGPYLRDMYQLPGVADTCHLEAVKQSYYGFLFPLNPGGIIPAGPDITNLSTPHGRETLVQATQSR